MFFVFTVFVGQFVQALEDLGVRVRKIETTQSEILEVVKRMETIMQHFQYHEPATTQTTTLPIARTTPLPTATTNLLPTTPTLTLPTAPTPPSATAQTTRQATAPNTPLPTARTAPPLPMAPTTPQCLFPATCTEYPAEPNHLEPLGLNHIYFNQPLPSDQVSKHTLVSVEECLKGCKELRSVEKASTLAQKLAKEAIFGVDVMMKCTPGGTKEFPALPKGEMLILKNEVYKVLPQFWHSPADFEKLWKSKCWPAVEQACRRLRRRGQVTKAIS